MFIWKGRREGWGSAEATEMVLNNLFYITVKFGDDHPKEMEDVWAELCNCWPTNLRVILRYLFIVTGMAPAELLPFVSLVLKILIGTFLFWNLISWITSNRRKELWFTWDEPAQSVCLTNWLTSCKLSKQCRVWLKGPKHHLSSASQVFARIVSLGWI